MLLVTVFVLVVKVQSSGSGHFPLDMSPGHYSIPGQFPRRTIPPPSLHGVGHFPLPPYRPPIYNIKRSTTLPLAVDGYGQFSASWVGYGQEYCLVPAFQSNPRLVGRFGSRGWVSAS